MNNKIYDLIVVGGGAAGMIAAITASRDKKSVLLLEKLPQIGTKLKATGGGRCNLTNTLDNEEFMQMFGKNGRFMQDALNLFDHKSLMNFFKEIGVETHAPDGFRVFPSSHSSSTIIEALLSEMQRVGVEILKSQRVKKLLHVEGKIVGASSETQTFYTKNIIVATGGLGYPTLGAQGDGLEMAKEVGHFITELHPAMMPLQTREKWVEKCRADTIAKVELRVDMKKHSKIKAFGDLIFTKNGIRGPVVLDAARDLTPLLDKYGEVPILLNLTKGMNEEQLLKHIKNEVAKNQSASILELLTTLLPAPISTELCELSGIKTDLTYGKISGECRAKLIKLLAWTPLSIVGHEGFKMAMITRGGVDLKEIEPKTMQSKVIDGLYFCGEIMNLDGPCGGYNLQWSFSSGFLAGKLK
ncbi:HI0933-like protein [Sulfurimonas denitrificans DSM 1251]|jgi:predicted Rossmann fold flavoprotein|uniref:HI0933-like protein n=1 Tax=Sulfurimonas denitrificans (strain ATCC 33889 / DSM 1251) TaxID=326298 RepID=Q30R66_SULDN|nr:NAD(P)/FAD-dependent oxidoreductase [Sulfurimonas denitrificans]ABB44515.1 HI0933-like protein [Sulfurimonas denitrificans DSM 1251]MDD3441697.1 NAD(P)/FAD-dependent oxidoreductase [Sulfurimonas denitrificans]